MKWSVRDTLGKEKAAVEAALLGKYNQRMKRQTVLSIRVEPVTDSV